MSLLQVFKPQEEPLELILPGECPIDTSPQGMDSGIEEPLAPSLGALAVAGIFCDVGDHVNRVSGSCKSWRKSSALVYRVVPGFRPPFL